MTRKDYIHGALKEQRLRKDVRPNVSTPDLNVDGSTRISVTLWSFVKERWSKSDKYRLK